MLAGLERAEILERALLGLAHWAEEFAAADDLHRVHAAHALVAVGVELDVGALGRFADRFALRTGGDLAQFLKRDRRTAGRGRRWRGWCRWCRSRSRRRRCG